VCLCRCQVGNVRLRCRDHVRRLIGPGAAQRLARRLPPARHTPTGMWGTKEEVSRSARQRRAHLAAPLCRPLRRLGAPRRHRLGEGVEEREADRVRCCGCARYRQRRRARGTGPNPRGLATDSSTPTGTSAMSLLRTAPAKWPSSCVVVSSSEPVAAGLEAGMRQYRDTCTTGFAELHVSKHAGGS